MRRFDGVRCEMAREGLSSTATHIYGTINCNGVNAKGEICGVTTTSGLAWKIPGRVGDSPILGAGLYVDGDVGAAGSTGRGEANLYNLSSYLIVENDAARHAPQGRRPRRAQARQVANTVEKRLLKPNGDPNFNLNFYVLNATGEYAGVGHVRRGPGRHRLGGRQDGRRALRGVRRQRRTARPRSKACCRGRRRNPFDERAPRNPVAADGAARSRSLAVYVGTAALAVWLVHRFVVPVRRQAASVLSPRAAAFHRPGDAHRGRYGGIDILYGSTPFRSTARNSASAGRNPVLTTSCSQMIPWMAATRRAFGKAASTVECG